MGSAQKLAIKNNPVFALSPSHNTFLLEYLKDFNGVQAWIRAGHDVSTRVASAASNRVLAMVSIRAALKVHLEDKAAALGLTQDKTVREYMRLAFSDISEVVQWRNGSLILTDSEDLSPEVTSSIQQITQTTKRYRDTEEITLTVKLHPKTAALDALGKHLMMFQDVTVNNNLQVNVSISDLAKLIHAPLPPSEGDDNRVVEGSVTDG